MFRISIFKGNKITNQNLFDSLEALEAWKKQCIANNVWGKPERWVLDSPENPLTDEEKANSIDSEIVELADGTILAKYLLEAEYIVETEDITAELNYEKDIQKRINRINFGIRLFAELATRNVIRLKAGQTTIEQLLSAEEKLAKVQRLMGNSSTETALQTLIALDIPEIPSEEKALFVAKIQEYLQNGG